MLEHFDVIENPWIPVLYKTGKVADISIRTLFRDAASIQDIGLDNVLLKASLMRFFTAFLSDAYELETKDDRIDLFESGTFSEHILDAYVDKCKQRYGTSFDLFDSETPFLTQTYNPKIDGIPGNRACALCDAGQLDLIPPHGNTKLFNGHIYDDEFPGYTPAEFLRQLIVRSTFSKEGSGSNIPAGKFYWVSGINGLKNNTFPLFFFPKTGCLFTDLVHCMKAKSETGAITLNDIPAAWNNREEINGTRIAGKGNVKKGDPVTKVSFVSGLTFQPVRVVLFPSDDDLIHKCYMSTGQKLDKNTAWIDPFCSYEIIKNKKTKDVMPSIVGTDIEKFGWHNYLLVANLGDAYSIQPSVVVPLDETAKIMNVCAVGGTLKKGAALCAIYYDETAVPAEFIKNRSKAIKFRQDMDVILKIDNLNVKGILVKHMERVKVRGKIDTKNDSKNLLVKSMADSIQSVFRDDIDVLIGQKYTMDLADSDEYDDGWNKTMLDKVGGYVRSAISDTGEQFISAYASEFYSINIYRAKTEYQKKAYSIIKKYTGR